MAMCFQNIEKIISVTLYSKVSLSSYIVTHNEIDYEF